MIIEILTLFPEMAEVVARTSILDRAQKSEAAKIRVHNLRDYTHDKHRTVDDRPFGGGPGMLMKCDPLVEAIEAIQALESERALSIFLTPQGRTFKQAVARELSTRQRILLISGHYEGIDERVREGGWIDQEISIGDYVLTNGTLPALAVTDAIVRLLPGVLGNSESAEQDSFGEEGLLDWPQYTRPESFRGLGVPQVLLSGNHAAIAEWRREQSIRRTRERRELAAHI